MDYIYEMYSLLKDWDKSLLLLPAFPQRQKWFPHLRDVFLAKGLRLIASSQYSYCCWVILVLYLRDVFLAKGLRLEDFVLFYCICLEDLRDVFLAKGLRHRKVWYMW